MADVAQEHFTGEYAVKGRRLFGVNFYRRLEAFEYKNGTSEMFDCRGISLVLFGECYSVEINWRYYNQE